MTTAATHQPPTPERFFNAINAYQQTEAMKAALELEIFAAIAEGNTTAATIAKRCEAAERGVRILCDFLSIHGFLTKEGTQYALAPDSALFLNRHSPAYMGAAIEGPTRWTSCSRNCRQPNENRELNNFFPSSQNAPVCPGAAFE